MFVVTSKMNWAVTGKRQRENRRQLFVCAMHNGRQAVRHGDEEGSISSEEFCSECTDTDESEEEWMQTANPNRNCCQNCKRVVPLFGITSNVSFRKGFSIVRKPNTLVWELQLCLECKLYLCESNNTAAWPAFVWLLLDDPSDTIGQLMWRMLPKEWRTWWRSSVERFHPGIDTGKPVMTKDVSALYYMHKEHLSIDGMATTSSLKFVECFEKTMTFPQVRCPWGCGVSVGKTDTMPFDFFVQHFIPRKIQLYTKGAAQKRRCCFKKDMFSHVTYWFCNKKVAIRPSLVLVGGSPFILTCNHHSWNDHLSYLYPPRNPTGAVSFTGDNRLAQVVVVPRTIGIFRKHHYTNEYKMWKVTGNYAGIDTCNLSNERKISEANCVTNRRDKLVLLGRPDCLNQNDTLGFPSIQQEDIDDAVHMLSENERRSLIERCAIGSTYIPLEEVFDCQVRLKKDKLRTVMVTRTMADGSTHTKEMSYVPTWPQHPIAVLHYKDALGEPFPFFHVTPKNKRWASWCDENRSVVFFFLNLLHMVPKLWKAVDDSVATNQTWHGWALQYVGVRVLCRPCQVRRKATYPFYTTRFVDEFASALLFLKQDLLVFILYLNFLY